MSPRTTTFLLSALVALLGSQVNVNAQAVASSASSAVASAGQASITATSLLPSSQSVATPVAATPTVTVNTEGLPVTALATNLPDGYSVPDLASITANMPPATTVPLDTTYSAGASPTGVAGAPPIPTSFPVVAEYPPLDAKPPTDSAQVQQWLSELDLSDVPDFGQTTGACYNSPEAAAQKERCWWTCGGCTRSTDITVCPDKLDWGLSYDDGPSPYTPLLLDYLNANDLKTTFFVVGSRVLSRPEMVISEYMSGHQISVHTWSHPYLTNLTNAEIVAELGWTMKVIKDTIGVTPRTFRPPYGDIDDRVRAVAAKMGLTPIIWTTGNGVIFDTDDWNIPGGRANGQTSLARFNTILETAEQLDTGFIVLQHDLYQSTVDLAVGYVLPMALNESSPYTLKSLSQCLGWDESESYIETSSNDTIIADPAAQSGGTSFPVAYNTGSAAAPSASGDSTASGGSAATTTSGGSAATGQTTGGAAATSASTGNNQNAASRAAGFAPGYTGAAALAAVALGAMVVL